MNVAEPFVRRALAQPERVAVMGGERTITYGQLLTTVRHLATALRAAGVAPGDRVVLVVRAPVPDICLTLALAFVGAVSVGVPPGLARTAFDAVTGGMGVSYLVHDLPEPFGAVRLKAELRVADLLAAAPKAKPTDCLDVPGKSMWRIAISSGTSGLPKGVAFSHGGSMLNSLLQAGLFPMGPGDKMLLMMGLRSGFAVSYWLRCLYSGACLVLRAASGMECLRLIREREVTHVVTNPKGGLSLAHAAAQPASGHVTPAPSLRMLNVGGGKLSPQLRKALRAHVCPHLKVNYGATETYLVAVLDGETLDRHPESVGRLVPWVEAQAVDESGQPLPPGEIGTLRIRSPWLPIGYVGLPEESPLASAFRDGWFYSNDIGSVSTEGVVWLESRGGEVLNVGGVKLDIGRVERAILLDPGVLDCAVVDVPGKLGEPVLAAVVVANDGVDLQGLRKRCADAGHMYVPEVVVRVPDLPRNEGGKVDRVALRAKLARQLASGRSNAAHRP